MATALYEQSLTVDVAHRATANAGDYAGTTTADLATGTAAGKFVEEINCAVRGTSVQGSIRFFLYDGSTKVFLFEVPIRAFTVSAGVIGWSQTIRTYIPLPSTSHKLQFNCETNDSTDLVAKGKS